MDSKRIILVGEAFGREEEKVGKPFVGRSGQLLRSTLEKLGLTEEHYDLTNVCMFRPSDAEGNNRTPTEEEIRANLPRLYDTIEPYTTVILLGTTAHKALSLYHTLPLNKVSGKMLVSNQLQVQVSVWHPAYVLRNMKLLPEWTDMLRRALE